MPPAGEAMESARVFIVDDDEAVRSGLAVLLASCGLPIEVYGNPEDFFAAVTPDSAGCVLLDVRMPGLSGLELHQRLIEHGIGLPVIMLTGHGDVPMAVRAMKRGAFDFVQKPFHDQFLLDRINEALRHDRERRLQRRNAAAAREKLARLSAREREVMELLVAGLANKAIAIELGISERTVELHRARVMEKLEARSIAQIVQLALQVRQDGD